MPKKRKMAKIGWREWVSLPDLEIESIKAKIDTGARSSCLHAYDIEEVTRKGKKYVRFKVHPHQKNDRLVVETEAPLLEYRDVRSSSGESSTRPVILTTVELLDREWEIEMTLANRDDMGFRMLLGREAVRGRFLINPGKSYYCGKHHRR